MTASLRPPLTGTAPARPARRRRQSPSRAGGSNFRAAMAPETVAPPADDTENPAHSPDWRQRSVADRREQALQRLQINTAKPRRLVLFPAKRSAAQEREAISFWDVRRPAPPATYYVLAVLVTVFVVLGLVMVLSASAQARAVRGSSPFEIFNRQAMWAGIGCIGLVVACRINLLWVKRLATPLLLGATAGMLLPFVPGIGLTINGARSWVEVGPFSVQPSEFMKLALAVYSASLLVRRQNDLANIRRSLQPLLVLAALGAGICLIQGDLGSAIVMAVVVIAAAFIGGVPFVPLTLTAVAAGGAALVFVVSSERRINRFTAFLDIAGHKDSLSYQMYQGLIAIADGGFIGSGVGAGNGKLGYIPLAHSDFIFAVIADELGLIGTFAVVGGFALFVWFGIQAALASPDRFGMLLAGGIAAWFGVQAVINMGGVVGLMPVTGLTLPFFSAGGSSLFVSMTAAGLLLNIARRGQRGAGAVTAK